MTKQDIIQYLNKGCTIVLFTTKETIVLNIKHISLSIIDEILSSGKFSYNQIVSGRILR